MARHIDDDLRFDAAVVGVVAMVGAAMALPPGATMTTTLATGVIAVFAATFALGRGHAPWWVVSLEVGAIAPAAYAISRSGAAAHLVAGQRLAAIVALAAAGVVFLEMPDER